MFRIESKRDYKMAYVFLCDLIDRKDEKLDNIIISLKRNMRSFLREYYEDECLDKVIVRNYFDDYVVRIKCPEWIKSKADAEEWFHEEEEIRYIDRGYDCTGQTFTCWYTIKYWNGNWWCWHCLGIDI